MTDNRTDSPSSQSQTSTSQNGTSQNSTSQANTSQTNTPDSKNVVPNTATTVVKPIQNNVKTTVAAEPQFKKVNISIAGVNYPINCPIHEEEELRSAVYYINNFALDIKKEAPNIPQENLLVLSCLNLYEKIQAHKKSTEDRRDKEAQAENLVNKILKDAQSVL